MEPLLVVALLVAGAGVAVTVGALAGLRRDVAGKLAETQGELRRMADAGALRERGTDEVRREVSEFRQALDRLGIREEERRAREEQGWAVLQRVAAVLSGGQRTGRAGENVLRDALGHLPPSMLVTDMVVNGQMVEFALLLPDGRRLPVDSKWSSDGELQALAGATDPAERARLIQIVERTVARRAAEVSKYLDPSVTSPIGVAAVPDAAYAVLRRAHVEAYRQGVVVVPYSMALPAVLFVHSLVARMGAGGDMQACLADLQAIVTAMEATVENKVERPSTILANGAQELRGHLGRARVTLARAREPDVDHDDDREEPARPRLATIP